MPQPKDVKTDAKNDWIAPVKDDDPDNPQCTPYTASELGEDPYRLMFACKEIICIHQRPLVTNDNQDFSFPDVGDENVGEDQIILPAQRSSISINFATSSAYVVFGASRPSIGSNTAIEIPVLKGAFDSLIASSVILGSVIASYLLF
jgi:hypothetical protein